MSVKLYSYLAGIFDGEGFFFIAKSKPDDTIREFRYQAYVGLTIREKEISKLFQKICGGSVVCNKSKNPKHSDVYKWVANATALEKFIEVIGPFIQLKRKQLKVIHTLRKLKKRTGFKSISNFSYDKSESLYQELKKLNARGVNKSSVRMKF